MAGHWRLVFLTGPQSTDHVTQCLVGPEDESDKADEQQDIDDGYCDMQKFRESLALNLKLCCST
jgi:hypothetical protein